MAIFFFHDVFCISRVFFLNMFVFLTYISISIWNRFASSRSFKRTLIFCNTVKSCRAAEHALREVDLPSLSYHGEVPSADRSANLERFKNGDAEFLVSGEWSRE